MKRKSIIEEDGAVVVGKTRVLHVQMDSTSKVLGCVYELLDKEKATAVRAFIRYCDDNGFAIVNWVSEKK